MNRKRLKELAEDDRFIPGIYNYCDRWCERCPQTARCMNFALDQEEDAEPEERDVRNEAFWNKLSGIFRETIEMLEEMANEHGVDLKTLDTEEIQEEIAAKRDAAANHVLSRAARGYAKLADDWFKEKGELFFFPDVGPQSENVTVDEALEVIRWYQYFIAAKVNRAVRGSLDDETEEAGSDADGSAKVALIAIDRSIAAWGVIPHRNRFYEKSVFEIISFLSLLKQGVEDTFPRARSFKRPGLDEAGQL